MRNFYSTSLCIFLLITLLTSCVSSSKMEAMQKENAVLTKRVTFLETKLDSVASVTEKQKKEIKWLTEQLSAEKAKTSLYTNREGNTSKTKSISKEDEFNQKANFIVNFGKFIFWPKDYLPQSDFIIGVYGQTGLMDKLVDASNGKTINGKKIVVQRIEIGKPVQNVHICFFPEAVNASIPGIVKKIKKLPILVVTEKLDSEDKNYMLNFLESEDKVKFGLNRQNAIQAGLNVNLDLMKLSF